LLVVDTAILYDPWRCQPALFQALSQWYWDAHLANQATLAVDRVADGGFPNSSKLHPVRWTFIRYTMMSSS